ncbi:hypothetical protein Pfo_011107 [Paulownia fortunei]|nr:hypothetical protein Pfo_011107 [Paulownia fortunei]
MAGTDSKVQLDPTTRSTPPMPPPPPPPVLRNHYEVEYARFFPYSSTPKSTADHHRLLRRQKIRLGDGTWISSSSSTLQLFSWDTNGSETPQKLVLVISTRRKILEEHYISKLHFSWPQMSCVSQSHMRGSRVVFASYRNSSGQVEKFALRFFNSSESQSFIDLLKESLKNVRTFGLACSNMLSEPQSMNEFINSDEGHHRNIPVVHPINDGTQHASSEQATLPDDYGDLCSTLPPSFTTFLADSSSEAQEPPTVSNAEDFMSQMAKYMTAASFHGSISSIDFNYIRTLLQREPCCREEYGIAAGPEPNLQMLRLVI